MNQTAGLGSVWNRILTLTVNPLTVVCPFRWLKYPVYSNNGSEILEGPGHGFIYAVLLQNTRNVPPRPLRLHGLVLGHKNSFTFIFIKFLFQTFVTFYFHLSL